MYRLWKQNTVYARVCRTRTRNSFENGSIDIMAIFYRHGTNTSQEQIGFTFKFSHLLPHINLSRHKRDDPVILLCSLTWNNEGKITWQHPEVGWIHLSGSCTVCTSALTASEQHWCRCLPLSGSWLFWSRKIPWFSSCLSRPKHSFSHYRTMQNCINYNISVTGTYQEPPNPRLP